MHNPAQVQSTEEFGFWAAGCGVGAGERPALAGIDSTPTCVAPKREDVVPPGTTPGGDVPMNFSFCFILFLSFKMFHEKGPERVAGLAKM